MKNINSNREKNKKHYDKLYANTSIKNILVWLEQPERFLNTAIETETSWHGLYKDDFQDKIFGKMIMEIGCGDCVNAAMMARMGAQVFANDIAESSKVLIEKLNEAYEFTFPITFIEGDFLKNDLEPNQFDFVIGKAFLHHLTLDEEKDFIKETARILKIDGEARFFEPAVNSILLDEVRWHIPVKGRPSKFNKKAFIEWKKNDPHPNRSFSSKHFEMAGKTYFEEVQTMPVGTLERFSRLMRWGNFRNNYRKWALRQEKHIPLSFNRSFARSQLIIYKRPKNN